MPTISQFFNLLDNSPEWASKAANSKAFQEVKKSLAQELKGLALPPAFCELLLNELPRALDIEMSSLLLRAWGKRNEIAEYRDRQKYPAGESHAVPLLEHTVISKHQPRIKVVINQKPLKKIEFDLKFDVLIQLIMNGVVLKIRDGRIMEILVGSCNGYGLIEYAGLTILEKKTSPYEFPYMISLGEGVSI